MIIFDKADEDGLRHLLINGKGFSEAKVNNGLEKIKRSSGKKN